MGVLGLGPFLQKACPVVIKPLPDRLRSLSGKTIVIDATLITTRFHFAPVPHRHRHVLGWYRMIKELKDSNVSAVCIFDGAERNLAKARENERRRAIRRQAVHRYTVEKQRLVRLQEVAQVLRRLPYLDPTERERAAHLLQQLRPPDDSQLIKVAAGPEQELFDVTFDDAALLPALGDLAKSSLTPLNESSVKTEELDDMDNMPVLPQIHTHEDTPDLPYDSSQSVSEVPVILEDYNIPADSLPPTHAPQTSSDTTSSLGSSFLTSVRNAFGEVPATLASLYINYRQSISKLNSLASEPPPPPPLPSASLETPSLRVSDRDPDGLVTKDQHQLTRQEGKLWEDLAAIAASPEYDSATARVTAELLSLTKRSQLIAASFGRRANPPNSKTYSESKEILRAMGIQCLETVGAVEAEALASSLVINGFADYVGSEDTDVLAFEAPLIRNMTNRQGQLEIVHGADIRTNLQLTKNSYIDFLLLIGTDFTQRIKNVGPVRALKFIKTHGSIEQVVRSEPNYPPPVPVEEYLAQVGVARAMFRSLPPIPPGLSVEERPVDESEVTQVLQKYDLGRCLTDLDNWDEHVALEGNYFGDNPSAM